MARVVHFAGTTKPWHPCELASYECDPLHDEIKLWRSQFKQVVSELAIQAKDLDLSPHAHLDVENLFP